MILFPVVLIHSFLFNSIIAGEAYSSLNFFYIFSYKKHQNTLKDLFTNVFRSRILIQLFKNQVFDYINQEFLKKYFYFFQK